jgi:hypothetical protein
MAPHRAEAAIEEWLEPIKQNCGRTGHRRAVTLIENSARVVAQASLPVGQPGVSPGELTAFSGRQDARRPHSQDGCAPTHLRGDRIN